MGERSFYRVHWTDGTLTGTFNVTDTQVNVTGLTAGLRYSFTVVAVAGDNETESDTAEISHYTSKMMNRIFPHHGSVFFRFMFNVLC